MINIAKIFQHLRKFKASGGNCGQAAYAVFRFLKEKYGIIVNIGLIADTDDKDWLLDGEPSIYHVFVVYDGKKYDETGEITIKDLIDLSIDQYNDDNPIVYEFNMNSEKEEKQVMRIISQETDWDKTWSYFLGKLEKMKP